MKRGNEELGKAGSTRGGKEKLSRTDSTKDQDTSDLEQGALLPTLKDPKLWLVKCVSGRERETAICLMKKFIDKKNLKIMSIIAIDTLKNFIYVEAEKEHYVRQAIKGMKNVYSSAKITMVPTSEMPQVLSMMKPKKSGEGSSSAVSRHNFKIGQPVFVKSGEFTNVQGSVLKLEDDTTHVKPNQYAGAPVKESITFNYTQLGKLFHIGNRVKIVAGVEEGQMGMVLKVDHEVLTVLSDQMTEISVSTMDCESL